MAGGCTGQRLTLAVAGGAGRLRDRSIAMHGGCCIKPSRKRRCAITEMATRATRCHDIREDAPRVTDAVADFGTHP